MSVFLFLKQIVDIMYPYHWMDYMMVIMVMAALVYQILLVRPSVKEFFTFSDLLILIGGTLLTVSFLKNTDGYGIYVKVLSAFLMYFVGRIYYDRIKECYGALVKAAYMVVYINFFYRLYRFGAGFLHVNNAEGDLYYYDTDMAFAMILALIFIGMFGRNTMRKYMTMFLICPYMVFCSDAGIQKALLLVIVFLMFFYLFERAAGKQKITNILLAVSIFGLLLLSSLLMLPVISRHTGILEQIGTLGDWLSVGNMYVRYERWSTVWNQYLSAGVWEKLFGLNLCADGIDGSVGNMYLKILYTTGIAGMLFFIVFVVSVVYYVLQIQDRKTFYVMILLAVILLGTGITVDSMEATQMSWFPLMFSGMVISSVRTQQEEGINGRSDSFDPDEK